MFTPYENDLKIGKRQLFEKCLDNSNVMSFDGIEYWITPVNESKVIVYDWNGTLYLNTNENHVLSNFKQSCGEHICNQLQIFSDSLQHAYPSQSLIECIKTILFTIKKAKEMLDISANNRFDADLVKDNTTFLDLDNHLRFTHYTLIHEFLKKYNREYHHKFEPQESVLRLFASHGLLKYASSEFNLSEFKFSTNVFSLGQVTMEDDENFTNIQNKALKDTGDKSDLSLVSKHTKTLIATTSKNYKDYSGKGKHFDLNKILNDYIIFYKDQGISIKTMVVVRSKQELFAAIDRMTYSSEQSKNLLQNSLFLDWDDLNAMYRVFKNRTEFVPRTITETIMCKNINQYYRTLLQANHSTIAHYTDSELKLKFQFAPDIVFININIQSQFLDYKEQLINTIIFGRQRKNGNVLEQIVRIRLRDKFGHRLTDVLNTLNVNRVSVTDLVNQYFGYDMTLYGIYILTENTIQSVPKNIYNNEFKTKFIVRFDFDNQGEILSNLYKTYTTYNDAKLDICDFITLNCSVKNGNIILNE